MDKIVKWEDLACRNDLENIHRYLSLVLTDFPSGACRKTARLVSRIVELPEVAGKFRINNESFNHACNYDKKSGLYIDLTAKQFSQNLPHILVSPKISPLYEIDERETQKQRKMDDSLLDGKILLRDYYSYLESPQRFNPKQTELTLFLTSI